MKRLTRHLLSLSLGVLIGAGATLPADAHALWVNLTSWQSAMRTDGAMTRAYFGWGHNYPVDGLTDRSTFTNLNIYRQDGSSVPFQLESEGISSATLREGRPGLYTVAAVRHSSINTTYRQDGKLHKAKGPKTKYPDVVSSVYSQQFATAIWGVGPQTSQAPRAVGHTLELIPLVNPYTDAHYGCTLPVQLLWEGRPVPATQITAVHAGFSTGDDMSQRILTDRNGIAHLRLDAWGAWLLKARVERPAQGKIAAQADTEVYYTSLTFALP